MNITKYLTSVVSTTVLLVYSCISYAETELRVKTETKCSETELPGFCELIPTCAFSVKSRHAKLLSIEKPRWRIFKTMPLYNNFSSMCVIISVLVGAMVRVGLFDFRATRQENGAFDEDVDNGERIRGSVKFEHQVI